MLLSRRHPSTSRLLQRGLPLVMALLLSACGSLGSFRMWSPQTFGLVEAGTGLYVEPTMSLEQRQQLQQQIVLGRSQVERFYGPLRSTPYFVACISNACAVRFGSRGERASAFGDQAIRLSPSGLGAALIAHEWSHADLYHRIGGWWFARHVPRWFDEGLAVVIADEARHSEANWREIERRGLPTPALTDLVTRSDWTAAVIRYGEPRLDDPDNLRAVYSTAGHELRRWVSCAGPAGTLALLQAVRDGEPFDASYRRLGKPCVN